MLNWTSALGRITQGSHITYFSLMFFIAYTFKGHVHVFAGRVKIVSHSSCRISATLKYFCPLTMELKWLDATEGGLVVPVGADKFLLCDRTSLK